MMIWDSFIYVFRFSVFPLLYRILPYSPKGRRKTWRKTGLCYTLYNATKKSFLKKLKQLNGTYAVKFKQYKLTKYFRIQQFKKLLFYSVNIAVSQSTYKFQITAPRVIE